MYSVTLLHVSLYCYCYNVGIVIFQKERCFLLLVILFWLHMMLWKYSFVSSKDLLMRFDQNGPIEHTDLECDDLPLIEARCFNVSLLTISPGWHFRLPSCLMLNVNAALSWMNGVARFKHLRTGTSQRVEDFILIRNAPTRLRLSFDR